MIPMLIRVTNVQHASKEQHLPCTAINLALLLGVFHQVLCKNVGGWAKRATPASGHHPFSVAGHFLMKKSQNFLAFWVCSAFSHWRSFKRSCLSLPWRDLFFFRLFHSCNPLTEEGWYGSAQGYKIVYHFLNMSLLSSKKKAKIGLTTSQWTLSAKSCQCSSNGGHQDRKAFAQDLLCRTTLHRHSKWANALSIFARCL